MLNGYAGKLLFVDLSTDTEHVWHSAGDWQSLPYDEMRELTSILDSVLEGSTITYTSSLDDGYDTNLCEDAP